MYPKFNVILCEIGPVVSPKANLSPFNFPASIDASFKKYPMRFPVHFLSTAKEP